MKFKNTEKVKLIAGHAIILGHRPESLSGVMMSDKLEKEGQEFSKFGLFDSSSPNYTNYYPEVTAEDLHPKEEEFIEPIFRLLSNVTVHSRFNPIHFPVACADQLFLWFFDKLIAQFWQRYWSWSGIPAIRLVQYHAPLKMR